MWPMRQTHLQSIPSHPLFNSRATNSQKQVRKMIQKKKKHQTTNKGLKYTKNLTAQPLLFFLSSYLGKVGNVQGKLAMPKAMSVSKERGFDVAGSAEDVCRLPPDWSRGCGYSSPDPVPLLSFRCRGDWRGDRLGERLKSFSVSLGSQS